MFSAILVQKTLQHLSFTTPHFLFEKQTVHAPIRPPAIPTRIPRQCIEISHGSFHANPYLQHIHDQLHRASWLSGNASV
jgi:hypothetical protein